MNIWCLLGIHNYKRVGPIEPIKEPEEFTNHGYIGHYALGKCKHCGKEKLIKCAGAYEWRWSEEMTKEQYYEMYVKDEPITSVPLPKPWPRPKPKTTAPAPTRYD